MEPGQHVSDIPRWVVGVHLYWSGSTSGTADGQRVQELSHDVLPPAGDELLDHVVEKDRFLLEVEETLGQVAGVVSNVDVSYSTLQLIDLKAWDEESRSIYLVLPN